MLPERVLLELVLLAPFLPGTAPGTTLERRMGSGMGETGSSIQGMGSSSGLDLMRTGLRFHLYGLWRWRRWRFRRLRGLRKLNGLRRL